MDVFTSAKSAQYVEILGQRRKQTSKNSQRYVLNLSVGRHAWLQQHSSARKVGTVTTHSVLVTEAVTGPITNSIVLGSAHWQHTSNIFSI